MKKNKNVCVVLMVLLMLFSLAACGPETTGETPSASPTVTPPADSKEYKYVGSTLVQEPGVRDWTTMWWRDGFQKGVNRLCMQTGYYGLAIDVMRGGLSYIGAIEQEYAETDAAAQNSSIVEALSQVSMDYSFGLNGEEHGYYGMEPIGGGSVASRILETGRYMQRVDVMCMRFKGIDGYKGRLEVAAMPEYAALEFSVFSPDKKTAGANLSFTLKLGAEYTQSETAENGRVLTMRTEGGSGLTFVLPAREGVSLAVDGTNVTFRCENVELSRNDFTGFGVIVIPSVSASVQDAQDYLAAERVEASAVQISPKEGREQETVFDTNKGYLSIDCNKMMVQSNTDFIKEEYRDMMDRLTFTLKNTSGTAVKLPIQFHKENRFGVTGFCPMVRDAVTGEPVGVQVQLSKNWHSYTTDKNGNYAAANDPKRAWSGNWFHGYTVIEIPANSEVTYEFAITYSNWGGVYACSHSQISLAGWGGNYQQWETSAIGSFGEAFCYDPETAHGRSFIDDIRPLNVTSMSGQKYDWTGCNGGGNFLFYNTGEGRPIVYFKEVRTRFKNQGPNLTEVIYTGVTTDGAVRFEITANLPRTNDASRAWHTFKYTFLKDVTFDRMAFYQFGADNYNDNQWDTMAVGNDSGTVSFEIDGVTYGGEFTTPLSETAGYVGGGSMQRVDTEGEGLWFAFMKCVTLPHKVGPNANRMLNVVSYNAELNGKSYSKPSFNLRYTTNYNIPCLLVELCPPSEVGNTIKAGSTVEGCVEYINLPVNKSDYYGPSAIMNGIDESEFNTWKLAYRYAVGNKTKVTASVGTVARNIPIKVQCAESGDVLAEISVQGGMSYVPLTFAGVPSYSGYRLYRKSGEAWEMVDQSTFGNDYWQAWYDTANGTYELTFNVEHSGDPNAVYEYRLMKAQ